MVSFISINMEMIISILSLVVSIFVFIRTDLLTKKLSSKEYQINEDLKYSLLQVIASLRSIDCKAAYYLDIARNYPGLMNHVKKDFSHEIENMTNLQMTPGYLLFLKSIKDSEARKVIDYNYSKTTLEMPTYDFNFIRRQSHMLLRLIQENLNPTLLNNRKTYQLMIDLCKMEGVFTNFDYDKLLEVEKEVNSFTEFLERKGIKKYDITYSDEGIVTSLNKELEEFRKESEEPIA